MPDRSRDRTIAEGDSVVWVQEDIDVPHGSRLSASEAGPEHRRWVVSVQVGTHEGVEETARGEFGDAHTAVRWARQQGETVLVRTIDSIGGQRKFDAGREPHPWPDWPDPGSP